MSRKFSVEEKLIPSQRLVPSMLNRRRITLKKILNRYMGLPFTQYQPTVTCDDVCEAGLGDVFSDAAKNLVAETKIKKQVAEPVAIEVRGVAVALDEEVSFSYYRYLSLQSPIYSLPLLPKLTRYQQYCQLNMQQENIGSHGVGKALKKRALHDFMQDMLPVVHHVPIIRLSVFDQFIDGENLVTLSDILSEDDTKYYQVVADSIAYQLEELDTLFLAGF